MESIWQAQPLVFVAVNLQVAVVDVALEDVAVEVVHAVGGRLLDQLTQQLALGDVNRSCGRSVAGRTEEPISMPVTLPSSSTERNVSFSPSVPTAFAPWA